MGIEVGPTGARRITIRTTCPGPLGRESSRICSAQAEYGVVFMKDMRIRILQLGGARKCPTLGKRDLLRECLDEAKKHEIPIIAYCLIQGDGRVGRSTRNGG